MTFKILNTVCRVIKELNTSKEKRFQSIFESQLAIAIIQFTSFGGLLLMEVLFLSTVNLI